MTLVLCAAIVAHAEGSREKARASFRRASKLYDFGEFAKALTAFKEAYDEIEDPAILYNIAQCHRRLGHPREAIDVYQSYLRRASPAAPNRAEVQAMIEKLQKTLPPAQPIVAQPQPEPTVAVAPATVTATAPPPRPLYRRWQLWVPVAVGVVVIGGAVGLGVALTTPHNAPYTAGTMKVQF